MVQRIWLLKRNCSLTPRQTAAAFALLCAMSLSVALTVLLLYGLWIVLGFAILELALVATALLIYARHATDHERIALMEGCVRVEQCNAGVVHAVQLETRWLRVTPPQHRCDLVMLEARGVRVAVGHFVTDTQRRQLARELGQGLHSTHRV